MSIIVYIKHRDECSVREGLVRGLSSRPPLSWPAQSSVSSWGAQSSSVSQRNREANATHPGQCLVCFLKAPFLPGWWAQ